MCLIAFSPKGNMLERSVFDCARAQNPDGIGIMSCLGVEKFVGRKAAKRAWRYMTRELYGIPHAVHFRYATHGAINRALCHPFTSKSGALVMHNGVLHKTAKYATLNCSDTSLFVQWYMEHVPDPAEQKEHARFKHSLEKDLGYDNKMVIYHPFTDSWTIANEDEGHWKEGFWYSNEYSLPRFMQSYWEYEWHGRIVSAKGYAKRFEEELSWQSEYQGIMAPPDAADAVRAAVRSPLAVVR
jgi:hypothetical protein